MMKDFSSKEKLQNQFIVETSREKADFNVGRKHKGTRLLLKFSITNAINVFLIIAIFYLLGQLPVVAGRIKELRSAQFAAEETANVSLIKSEIERSEANINTLQSLFAGDLQFVDFIERLTKLKEEGVISSITFPGGPVEVKKLSPVRAKGFPVILEFRGNQDSVNSGLSKVFGMPFLFSPQEAELIVVQDSKEKGEIILNIGLYIIVNESFAKN